MAHKLVDKVKSLFEKSDSPPDPSKIDDLEIHDWSGPDDPDNP